MPLSQARDLLQDVTPLKQNCGALCSAACCQDEEDEELGMLLFPGEERLYSARDAGWMKIVDSAASFKGRPLPLLICRGECPRERRPLACRVFPLAPGLRKGRVVPRVDGRGAHICPLYDSGVAGLAPRFVDAVEQAFDLLSEDPTQREFLLWTSKAVDDHARVMRLMGTRR
jgi:hypothetical protein